ncbi:MAG: ribosome recycling factor [Candidatus Wolfebacteria bacterium]|nr:ribosome recycling factor [Candidatus Wolfebacteria bacterium]
MDNILKKLEIGVKESVDHFKSQLSTIRGNRPSPKLVEDITIEYYGQKLTVKQVGAISVAPPREIQISIWDKNAVNIVAKAIESSNLNVSSSVDGNVIHINLPPLSQERREELVKIVKKESELARIGIRSHRDEAIKESKNEFEAGKITEDDKFKSKDKIQEITDRVNEEIEKILEQKIREIEE